MSFTKDLEDLGIVLDPNKDPSGNCPTEGLSRVLYAVTKLLPVTSGNASSVKDMKELLSQFENGFQPDINEDTWRMDVEGHLRDVFLVDYPNLPPDQKIAFDMAYTGTIAESTALYSDPFDVIREAIGKAHTLEEMDAVLSSLQGASATAPLTLEDAQSTNDFKAKLGYRWDIFSKDVQDHFHNASIPDGSGFVQSHMTEKKHLADPRLMEQYRTWLTGICDRAKEAGKKDPAVAAANRAFGVAYQRSLADYKSQPLGNRSDLDTAKKASAAVERMIESVDTVADLVEKMRAESGHHHDSDEYKAMKAYAELVADMRKNFDPDDRLSIADMEGALRDLHRAATKYAEKEAFKSKKTSRGIERKNTALALLAASDPGGVAGVEKYMSDNDLQIKDFRRDKKEAKKARDFKSLVEEEKASTHSLAEKQRAKRDRGAKGRSIQQDATSL